MPRERRTHIPPPLADHVERVAELLAPQYVLPLLVIDECGPRVSELATAVVGDLDEERRAIRVRPEAEKNERYRYLHLPDRPVLGDPGELPPREDRDLETPLFPGLDEAALRTAIGRACKLAGVPHFSPHGLRRRRGSLHYKRTGSLAEVAELLGDSKRVAADHYVYALSTTRRSTAGRRCGACSPETVSVALPSCSPRCSPRGGGPRANPHERGGYGDCSISAAPIQA